MKEDYLKLRELIKLELKNIRLYHSDVGKEAIAVIPEINLSQFSEFGKVYWNEALEAKVDKFTENKLFISKVDEGMFRAFRELLLGENESEMYEKCIIDKQALVADDYEKPDMTYKKEFAMLTAVYENLSETPDEERCTAYFDNVGEYLFRQNQTLEKVNAVVEKALDHLGMEMKEFINESKHMTCQLIKLKMRENMMAQKIAVGNSILFVTQKPENHPDTFEFIAGEITSIDEESKQCHIENDSFVSTDVSFRYILGIYNPEIDYEFFGYESCELFLGANINDAHYLLAEAMTLYHEQNNEEETQGIEMQEV